MQKINYTYIEREKNSSEENLDNFLLIKYNSAKIDLGLDGDDDEINVSLNVYMCGLLENLVFSQASEFEREFVSDRDFDVFDKVKNSMDDRFRFRVYRANADHRLVYLGLLGHQSIKSNMVIKNKEEVIEKTSQYYLFASRYLVNLPHDRKRMGFSDNKNIFDYLAARVDKCVNTLSYMSTNIGILDSKLKLDIKSKIQDGCIINLKSKQMQLYDQLYDTVDVVQRRKILEDINQIKIKLSSLSILEH